MLTLDDAVTLFAMGQPPSGQQPSLFVQFLPLILIPGDLLRRHLDADAPTAE